MCRWHSSCLRSTCWIVRPVNGSGLLCNGPASLAVSFGCSVVNAPRALVMWSTGPVKYNNRIKSNHVVYIKTWPSFLLIKTWFSLRWPRAKRSDPGHDFELEGKRNEDGKRCANVARPAFVLWPIVVVANPRFHKRNQVKRALWRFPAKVTWLANKQFLSLYIWIPSTRAGSYQKKRWAKHFQVARDPLLDKKAADEVSFYE